MKEWILPTLGAMGFWGLWGFLPKITTRYLEPRHAIVYEVMGAIVLAIVMLGINGFQLAVEPRGIAVAVSTGVLGFLGAFCFLTAVSTGPVTLVATLSSLYPVISVILAVSILHESLSVRQGIGIGLAIASMILIAG